MSYKIKLTKQALKDYEKIKKSPLSKKVKAILQTLEDNPYKLPYEKLSGDFGNNTYSRRINIRHRIVYELEKTRN